MKLGRGTLPALATVALMSKAVLGDSLGAVRDALGVANGFVNLVTDNFSAVLVRDSQVLVSLKVAGEDFDFLPYDRVETRNRNGQYHWGDVTFRYREQGVVTPWIEGDSSTDRHPVRNLTGDGTLSAADLESTLPDGPFQITRQWLDTEGDLALRVTIENTSNKTMQLGSLGLPSEFNNIMSGRGALEMQQKCSMADPYIGFDAGHLRVMPLSPGDGSESVLVVTPLQDTETPLVAYRNLHEPSFADAEYNTQLFEGLYEWQVLTQAWTEVEWTKSSLGQWNAPTERTLEPGQSTSIGVRFSAAQGGPQSFDEALRRVDMPTAAAVPGYILQEDVPGKLYLNASSRITSFSVLPKGALVVEPAGDAGDIFTVTPSGGEAGRGQARLTVKYEDGKTQTIHYYVTKPGPAALDDLGSFLFNEAWYEVENDYFNRSPSIMSYDYNARSIILQEPRNLIAGLSDEGGAGAYVAGAVKQFLQPAEEEIEKLDRFARQVVRPHLQREDYSVVRTLFYYEAEESGFDYSEDIAWNSWNSWDREYAMSNDRAYNYVHPATVYWILYRISRSRPDVVSQDWEWYLDQASRTASRINGSDIHFTDVGLMGETVFGEILKDLGREGWADQKHDLEMIMEQRARAWDEEDVPYGSELGWDSTGQEGVYYWTRYFGLDRTVQKTVNSVLAYMPNVPHWGWNGNARRYWDFQFAGKIRRVERQIHHYGSGLNSQVLLGAFRDAPNNTYLLRVGYAGVSAALANINAEGFPSAAFHSFPDTLKWDSYTGDYGMGLVGTALNGGVYVADDPALGLVAYGGLVRSDNGTFTVELKGAMRRRAFLGPLSLQIEVDAGVIERVECSRNTVTLVLGQQPRGISVPQVVVWLESGLDHDWRVEGTAAEEARGGWVVPLGNGTRTVTWTSE